MSDLIINASMALVYERHSPSGEIEQSLVNYLCNGDGKDDFDLKAEAERYHSIHSAERIKGKHVVMWQLTRVVPTEANPNLPPEIVEGWRSEFEKMFSPLFNIARQKTVESNSMVLLSPLFESYRGYESPYTDCAWQGFLMARQSVVIELKIHNYAKNSKDPHDMHGAFETGFDDGVDECAQAIEAQGYAVSRE